MLTDWDDARHRLFGATCLWQDLDGLHREPAPAAIPLTSILWAWWNRADGRTARLRLDSGRVYLAIETWPNDPISTIAWGADDDRPKSFRAAGNAVVTEQFDIAIIDHLTFIRPTAAD
ncbi:hypothetical protein ACWDXV_34225 [Nocardia nova]